MSIISQLFPESYKATDRDREAFGQHWCGPDVFEHGEWHTVAQYKGKQDGRNVLVQCSAMPSRFYRVVVPEHAKDDGTVEHGFTLQTGSGVAMVKLAAQIADAIAEGMLDQGPMPILPGQTQ
jgi:hypothetical protein